jgi:hypothetical protein
MRNPIFFPFGPPPIANLERRVAMQRRALDQAIEDLNEAREAQGPSDPSAFLSPAHHTLSVEAERRRRGLGPRTRSPEATADTADMIVAADRQRRGLDAPEGPPQNPPTKVTAEDILAAYAKANQGMGKK